MASPDTVDFQPKESGGVSAVVQAVFGGGAGVGFEAEGLWASYRQCSCFRDVGPGLLDVGDARISRIAVERRRKQRSTCLEE